MESADAQKRTKVDFYLLTGDDSTQRFRTACRIVEKAYTMGHRVHIHSDTMEHIKQLDDILWTFRDRSFIPHEIASEGTVRTSVTLGHGWIPEKCDVLVNLADNVPEFFSRFSRVAEIIDEDALRRKSGRVRYRHYLDLGYTPDHHKLQS